MAFRFKNFKVYQDAKSFHRKVVFTSKTFPREYYYLRDQLNRASLSVILNIAEGSGKSSDKDFKRYLGNSLGSISEIVACLEVAKDLNLISQLQLSGLEDICLDIANQLGGFSKKLSS